MILRWMAGVLTFSTPSYCVITTNTGRGRPAKVFHDDFLRKYVSLEQAARSNETHRHFWQQQLSGYEPMPLPRLRVKNHDIPTIEYHDIAISSSLSHGLREVAARLNVPLKNVLMAAHLRVLSFIANTENVITGYEHSGRPEEEGWIRLLASS